MKGLEGRGNQNNIQALNFIKMVIEEREIFRYIQISVFIDIYSQYVSLHTQIFTYVQLSIKDNIFKAQIKHVKYLATKYLTSNWNNLKLKI